MLTFLDLCELCLHSLIIIVSSCGNIFNHNYTSHIGFQIQIDDENEQKCNKMYLSLIEEP